MASDTSLPLTGGCNCGAVRFEVTETPRGAVYCHCTRCQRRTGSAAAATAGVHPGSVRVVSGEDRIGAWKPGDGFEKEFCQDCGSALFARDNETGEVAGVRLGAFDSDPGVRPGAHQYVAYAAAWEPLPDDGLPRFPERRTG
ncbi:MAG: GFA family protein [Solirubrobacteraceae bacterium]